MLEDSIQVELLRFKLIPSYVLRQKRKNINRKARREVAKTAKNKIVGNGFKPFPTEQSIFYKSYAQN